MTPSRMLTPEDTDFVKEQIALLIEDIEQEKEKPEK